MFTQIVYRHLAIHTPRPHQQKFHSRNVANNEEEKYAKLWDFVWVKGFGNQGQYFWSSEPVIWALWERFWEEDMALLSPICPGYIICHQKSGAGDFFWEGAFWANQKLTLKCRFYFIFLFISEFDIVAFGIPIGPKNFNECQCFRGMDVLTCHLYTQDALVG